MVTMEDSVSNQLIYITLTQHTYSVCTWQKRANDIMEIVIKCFWPNAAPSKSRHSMMLYANILPHRSFSNHSAILIRVPVNEITG